MWKADQCMQRTMSPNTQERKVTASFKLPPDLEKNINTDLDAGKYRSRSDAYVSVMREYYHNRELEEKILQRLTRLEERMAEVEAELRKKQ